MWAGVQPLIVPIKKRPGGALLSRVGGTVGLVPPRFPPRSGGPAEQLDLADVGVQRLNLLVKHRGLDTVL